MECVGLALALAVAEGDGVADTDVDPVVDGDVDVVEVDGVACGGCDDAPLAVGCDELAWRVAAFATARLAMQTDSPQPSRATATRRATAARMREEDA